MTTLLAKDLELKALAEFTISDKRVKDLINIDAERQTVKGEVEDMTAGEIVFEATNYQENTQVSLKDFVKMLEDAGIEEIEAKWVTGAHSNSTTTIVCSKTSQRPETDDEVISRVVNEMSERVARYKKFLELEKEFGE